MSSTPSKLSFRILDAAVDLSNEELAEALRELVKVAEASRLRAFKALAIDFIQAVQREQLVRITHGDEVKAGAIHGKLYRN